MKQYKAVLKPLLSLAVPIIFANILSASAGLISMFFIAYINHSALAAGGLITSTYGLIILMVISILYSVGILIGQSHGAKRDAEFRPIVYSGIIIVFLFGIPLTAILYCITPILQFLHQPLEVSQLAGQYFHGVTYGFIPNLIAAVFVQFFMGISKAKVVLYFTILNLIAHTLLSYILIFGFKTIEPMGVFGAGLANSIAAWIFLATILIYVGFSPELKKYQFLSRDSFDRSYWKLLLKIGLPISIQYTIEMFAFSIITYLMGAISADALGAQQIALQCSLIASMITMGFSQSSSILISQSFGKGTATDRNKIIICALSAGNLCMLGIALIYWIFPNSLIGLYVDTKDPALFNLVRLAKLILYIAAFTQIFNAGRNIAAGLLRGYGDTKSSLYTSFISCWIIGLPLSMFLAFGLKLEAVGLRLGILFGILFGCFHLIHRVNKMNKLPYPLTFQHQSTSGK